MLLFIIGLLSIIETLLELERLPRLLTLLLAKAISVIIYNVWLLKSVIELDYALRPTVLVQHLLHLFDFHILYFVRQLPFSRASLAGGAILHPIALFEITACKRLYIFIIDLVIVVTAMVFLVDVIVVISQQNVDNILLFGAAALPLASAAELHLLVLFSRIIKIVLLGSRLLVTFQRLLSGTSDWKISTSF